MISCVSGWEIFVPDFAKAAAPVIQPDLETLVSERLLNNDVGRAVPVNVQGGYCQRGFVRFEGEINIPAAREMKFYRPDAALGPQPFMIDKDGAIGFVITIEIGNGECLTERCPKMYWRCEIRP